MLLSTQHVVKGWKRENDITNLPWLAQSPDLNLVENLWDILVRFRTNRIESNFKVIRFDSIRFELKKTGFDSIRIRIRFDLIRINSNS